MFYLSMQELVLEKETRLRESMKMMGLSGWILWLTWYLKQFLFLMIAVILMTILIKVRHVYIVQNSNRVGEFDESGAICQSFTRPNVYI